MITRLQSWAATALAVLAVLVGAYAAGGRAARQSIRSKRDADEIKLRRRMYELDQKVSAMDISAIDSDLDRWVRDKRPR